MRNLNDVCPVAMGRAIRIVRVVRGLTQTELAAVLGCTPGGVSTLEVGKLNGGRTRRRCPIGQVRRMAEALGVPVRVFIMIADRVRYGFDQSTPWDFVKAWNALFGGDPKDATDDPADERLAKFWIDERNMRARCRKRGKGGDQ